MQPDESTVRAIQDLILWCKEREENCVPAKRLSWKWFACQRGLPEPMWIDIARYLFRYPQDEVKTVLKHAHRLRTQSDNPAEPFRNCSSSFKQAYTPEDILGHAASANGWKDATLCLNPQSLRDRLLRAALSASPNAAAYGPATLGQLSLTHMLAYEQGRFSNGLLLALNLQPVDSTPHAGDVSPDQDGPLIPAPAAALLQTDDFFNSSLAVVNHLLKQVLKPGAPAIAWSFASLALSGDSVQAFAHIQGPSASAALAYGALYLLRHHLDTTQPHIARLADHLSAIESPHTVSTTAELVASGDPAQPWPWLRPVDGVPEKIAALSSSLPLGRTVTHRFVATQQIEHSLVTIEAKGAEHLGDLIKKIAIATTSLDDDGRLLHAALQQDRKTLSDAAIADDPALQGAINRLRTQAMPGFGVRAHLIWRYAQLCAGQHSPFGDVARLGKHFVSLRVEGPKGHGDEKSGQTGHNTPDSADAKARESRVCNRLQDILYPSPDEPELHQRWHSVPAWCIQAPPFAGKSTLIQHWELTRIRDALHSQAQGQGWGEVPVFLPMNAFMRHSRRSQPSADDLGRDLRDYAQQLAPALPWAELLPEQPPTPAQLNTPRPDGLRVRLCIDALNEYRTGQANEGSAIRLLCDWLAPRCAPHRSGALLPPLFSVRREEAANFTLNARHSPDWVAHTIQVKDWSPSQMRAYVIQRALPLPVQTRLLQALGLPGANASDDECSVADAQGPANPVALFSQVPGFLSAQCTLLERWPHLPISGRRAPLMLALAWHALDKWQRSSAFEALQARAASDPALAALLAWLLPESALNALQQINQGHPPPEHLRPRQAGGLLGGLALVAEAMQDPQGGTPAEAAPWDSGDGDSDGEDRSDRDDHYPTAPHPFLSAALAPSLHRLLQTLPSPPLTAGAAAAALRRMGAEWREHSKDSGLAFVFKQPLELGGVPVPWLKFSHQQIQEFFSALSVTPNQLPDLTPPPFKVPTEKLDDFLRQKGAQLELPAVTSHTERLRYAADLATREDAAKLIAAVLNQGNLALAAQLAIDQRTRLERPADASGRVVSHGFWFPENREHCHPLLQHIRARLLLASVDTGAATLRKLHASGILAGIADTVQKLSEPWRSQWLPLLPALRVFATVPPALDHAPGWPTPLTTGVDLRQRLHYGLLLGELGDNIRYERVSITVEGRERTGICLKAAHWALIPASGPGVVHRIGSDHAEDKDDDNHPAWTVPDGELPPTLFAQTPAVVMQWQAYLEHLQARQQPAPALRAMGESRFNNPLQPVTSLDWFTAQAFTAWAAPLHQPLAVRLPGPAPGEKAPTLGLPTEVQHEAAARFDPAQPRPTVNGWWPHDKADRSAPGDWSNPGDLPPTLFNHHHTRWDRPAPVGVFSAALSPIGIEAMGNAWTWCSNLCTQHYRGDNARLANRAETVASVKAKKSPWLALRGGSFYTADLALAAYRNHYPPDYVFYDIGLRWQMSRPISEP